MKQDGRSFWKQIGMTFFLFFLCNAFVIASSFYLFFHWIELNPAQLKIAAPITFLNVFLLTVILTGIYAIRSRFTVTRPARKIQEGLDRITRGDFTGTIPPSGVNPQLDAIAESINRMTAELGSVETFRMRSRRRWLRSAITPRCCKARGFPKPSAKPTPPRSRTPPNGFRG